MSLPFTISATDQSGSPATIEVWTLFKHYKPHSHSSTNGVGASCKKPEHQIFSVLWFYLSVLPSVSLPPLMFKEPIFMLSITRSKRKDRAKNTANSSKTTQCATWLCTLFKSPSSLYLTYSFLKKNAMLTDKFNLLFLINQNLPLFRCFVQQNHRIHNFHVTATILFK